MRLPKAGEKWTLTIKEYAGGRKGDFAIVHGTGEATLWPGYRGSHGNPRVWWIWEGQRDHIRESHPGDFARNFEPHDTEAEPREVCDLQTKVEELETENTRLSYASDQRLSCNNSLFREVVELRNLVASLREAITKAAKL